MKRLKYLMLMAWAASDEATQAISIKQYFLILNTNISLNVILAVKD